jgi:hypothetical protein
MYNIPRPARKLLDDVHFFHFILDVPLKTKLISLKTGRYRLSVQRVFL